MRVLMCLLRLFKVAIFEQGISRTRMLVNLFH